MAPVLLSHGAPAMQYAPTSSATLCLEPEPARAEAPGSTPDAPTPAKVARQRVLLLEDDDEFREVVNDFLVSRFYDVTAVRDGAEGLREILKDPFDVIVCDMMMPQVNGEMFYWAVSRVRPAARLRFLFITGDIDGQDTREFLDETRCSYFMKPFNLERLTAAVDMMTGQRSPDTIA